MPKRKWENEENQTTTQYKKTKNDIFGSSSEDENDSVVLKNEEDEEDEALYDSSLSDEEENKRKKIMEKVGEMKINDLRVACRKYKISTKGVKQVIAERLGEFKLQRKMEKMKKEPKNNSKKELKTKEEQNEFVTSSCSHSKNININLNVKKKLFNPSLWSCEQCGTTGSVRCCFICGHIGCGNKFNSHSLSHFDVTSHPIVFSIHSKTTCCYICKVKIMNKEIEDICKGMKMVEEKDFCHNNRNGQKQKDDLIENNSLRESATALFITPEQYEIEDCYTTSIQHYRKYQISRFFGSLKYLMEEKHAKQFLENLNNKNNNNNNNNNNNIKEDENNNENNNENNKGKSNIKDYDKNIFKNIPMVPFSPILKSPLRTGPTGTPIISPLRTRSSNVTGNNDKIIENGFTGLRNLGNTCFMNSVIQSITSNERIRNYFIEELIPASGNSISLNGRDLVRTDTFDCLASISSKSFVPKSGTEISLCLEMHKLLRVLWSGKWTIVTPYSLLFSLWELLPAFKNYKQQDAEEFLCYLLDKINEELKAAMEREQSEKLENIPTNIKLNQKENQTIINEVFGGQIASRVVCTHCGRVSESIERFFDVAIDIPIEHFAMGRKKRNEKIPECSLYNCLDSFTNLEHLEENSYRCSTCYDENKMLTSATKQMIFHQLPEVLCITIKRFSWVNRAKIDTIVNFPLQSLDMQKYSDPKNKHFLYNLKSLIVHHGRSLNVGHYTSFAFNATKGNWLHYNDSKVRVVPPETVEECYGETPYILFYERQKPSIFSQITTKIR